MEFPQSAALTAVLGVAILWILCWRRSGSKRKFKRRIPGVPDQPVEYNIQEGKGMPAIPGRVARALLKLTHSLLGKVFLMPSVMRKTNVLILRDILMKDLPTFAPLIPWEGSKTPKKSKDAVDLMKSLASKADAGKKLESDFHFMDISDFHNAYSIGKLTPTDVAIKAIKNIKDSDAVEPKLRAFVEINEEQILEAAKESTNRYQKNKPLSVLDGVPVGIKDEIQVASHHLRMGSTYMGHSLETEDSEVIRRLRANGAIILGMTNMQENGMGTTGINISKYHGTPRNPYNVNHFTGGSSSGSAAAVAAGLCPVALGTDGGGSVRIPATFCGTVGLKPTFARIPCLGSPVNGFSVCSLGPLCNSVRDAAIAYACIAGPCPSDSLSSNQPPVELTGFNDKDLKGMKLGIDKQFYEHADPEIVGACNKALDVLKSHGAEVVDIQIPELEEARIAHIITILAEMRSSLHEAFCNQYSEQYFENAGLLSTTEMLTTTDYIQAQRQKTRTITFLKSIFKDVDVILLPGNAILAPEIKPGYLKHGFSDTSMTADIIRHVFLANLTGIPAMTVPVGYSMEGLPISLQIMGAWWKESTILQVGRFAEKCLEKRKPDVFYELL
ncbi:fatty acid amide hydrolase-like [Asterias rubens]|uniref:fatty acid amide hydrolase-like n=1 Tax=Asterias rubens TaxID=7604 RepID=UPI001455615F|nr:fatty acid amide hydrolase-like [Asterias rubens]